jgi:hypothetical protein
MKKSEYQPESPGAQFMLRPDEYCRVCGTHNELVVVIYTEDKQEVADGFEICADCIEKLSNIRERIILK